MRFECVDEVTHPVVPIYRLIRDDMPSLVPYLADVESIEVLEMREVGEGRLFILNLWRGSAAKAPKVVQKFLSPELLSWKDHATWHGDGPGHAEWRLEPKVGGSLFTCSGRTTLRESRPGCTEIKIEGDIRVYPEKVPGVPRLLAGRMRGKIEAFIVGMVVPNMQTMARGVQAYFDDQQAQQAQG